MTIIDQKHQILESLNALDHAQAEQVLKYINDLLYPSQGTVGHQRLKREALKEIRQALGNGRMVNPAF
jgi:hypothetical protein